MGCRKLGVMCVKGCVCVCTRAHGGGACVSMCVCAHRGMCAILANKERLKGNYF